MSLENGKSLGPDGFNVEFFKFYWQDLEDDLFNAVTYFFEHGSMPTSWGHTYIALIPKKDNPKLVTNYHPITLCNVSYKIIAKILANKMKTILPKLIGKEQSSFIYGRSLSDNIIFLQEVVHTLDQTYCSSLGWLSDWHWKSLWYHK